MDLQEGAFCSIDLETTGLDVKTDEIIAFAGIPIRNMKIMVHDAYYTLVKPEGYKIDAMKYHGISEDELENAPPFKDVSQNILNTIDGVILGHYTVFDYEFLKSHFKKVGIKLKRDIADIASVEKWLCEKSGSPGQDLTLDGIMRKYGLKSYYRHNAFADAFFTAQIFQMQLPELMRLGVHTVSRLIRIARYRDYSCPDLAF